ncbi:hypothetical protein KHS38_05215 [Mucilaginibacter sp. Bleaf8]|uniref:hypothetical protein n=1 Tax=Mucilaginibacter sp. Bleaf8 TaxID=2834430 RepID=UPI001BCB8FC8|nr:hypothetical protein [Mucilaginibacter sp. Bleaf8]MBS7563795.1 hypothetical protein [Mucilaginibacter sp. Bleaf8]
MRKKIDYIYYKFYKFQVSVGNGSIALTFSFIFLSFLMMINFFTGAFILYAVSGIKLPFGNPVASGLIIISGIALINYFLFIHKNRYKKILKRHEGKNGSKIKSGNKTVLIYMILSFMMLGVGFWLMIMRNQGSF